MDPNSLVRGPRRVLRRGDRNAPDSAYPGYTPPSTAQRGHDRAPVTDLRGGTAQTVPGEGGLQSNPLFAHGRIPWNEMRSQVTSSDDEVEASHNEYGEEDLEETDGEEVSTFADEGNDGTDREMVPEHFSEIADEDLVEERDNDFDFASQPDLQNDGQAVSFDPVILGLKEINNLAHFSVSSHKPGNGVEELLSDDLSKYWQSDGPQPHLLTIHFFRRVEIRAIRFYVDYNQDESYTPTFVMLSAGTGHHDLIEFATLALVSPVGWQEVDLSNAGGGSDGQSLCCWIVQVKVKENHQNGKDTHIRGIKIFAIDENALAVDNAPGELVESKGKVLHSIKEDPLDGDDYLFERLIAQSPARLPAMPERSGSIVSFMRDQEIR